MSAETLEVHTAIDPNGAIRSFFADRSWRVKAGIGATINALSVVVLIVSPMLLPLAFILWSLVCGYMLKVIRVKIKDPDAPAPEWREWLDLLISGLTWLAVYTGAFVFLLSILTIAMLIGAIQGSIYATDPRFVPWAVTTLTVYSMTWIMVALTTTYLQANFAEQEKMRAAFALRKVLRLLNKRGGPMVQAWLLAIGLHVLAIVVPLLTVIGVFFLPMTSFIAGTISATMVAQAWQAAQE